MLTPPTTLLPWLPEIFPDADAPYTMRIIIERLRKHHTPTISKSATYRALKALRRSRVTAPLVRAENEADTEREREYSPDAARRIARRVTRDRPPLIIKKP